MARTTENPTAPHLTATGQPRDRVALPLDRGRLELLRSRREFTRDAARATFSRLTALRMEYEEEDGGWGRYVEKARRTQDVRRRPVEHLPAELAWSMQRDIAAVDQQQRALQRRNAAEAEDKEAAIRAKWGAQLGPLVTLEDLGIQPHEQRAHDLKVERLTADIADQERHHKQVRERADAGTTILREVERFLAGKFDALPPFVVEIDPQLTGASLDELRAMLPPIAADRDAIARAPCLREEAIERLRQSIAESRQQDAMQIEPFVYTAGPPRLQMRGSAPPIGMMSHAPLEVLAQLRPEDVQLAGERQIAAFYKQIPPSGPGAPVSSTHRAELLAELEMTCRSVEYAEEKLLRSQWTDRHAAPDHRPGARAELALAVFE